MNSSNHKFRNLLLKEYKRLSQKLDKESRKYCLQNHGEAIAKTISSFTNAQIDAIDETIDNFSNDLEQKFRALKKEEIATVDAIGEILSAYENQSWFNKFDLVEKYLKKFGFSDLEQAEVLAYILNWNLMQLGDFNFTENKKEISKLIKDKIKEDSKLNNSFLLKHIIYRKNIKHYAQMSEQDKQNVQKIRNLISMEGELIPGLSALDLKEPIRDLGLNLTEGQIDLIVSASVTKAQDLITKEEQEKRAEAKRIQSVVLSQLRFEESLKHNKTVRLNERQAIESLKKYLFADKPLDYINDETLEEIVILMRQAAYSQERIIKIKKAIQENNIRIEQQIEQSNIIKAKELYLSIEEIEILKSAEMFLEYDNAIENELLSKLRNDYNLLNSELLRSYNGMAKDEDRELIHLLLEEIRDLIIEYSYSDYRIILAREKRGNDNE